MIQRGNSVDVSSVTDTKNKKNNFINMTPQHLLDRQHVFEKNLPAITKKHHQAFLRKRKILTVSEDKLVRWHPQFPVDAVPDIPVGDLPEEPDVKVYTARDVPNKFKGSVCSRAFLKKRKVLTVSEDLIVRWHPEFPLESVPDIPVSALPEDPDVEVFTARDVLNKVKGSVCSGVEKALKGVADGKELESNEMSQPETDVSKNIPNNKQDSELYEICSDLLEWIKAYESAKIIETRSVEGEERTAMLEKVPKIVNILWQYFIAERKKAIPIDVAVEKIIHSFNSLTTPDAVKEHLQLIRETMPGWISIIKISKGLYITIDKKKDINFMLANIK